MPTTTEPGATVRDGAQSGGEVTPRERRYLSALKKGEPLHGPQKRKCIDAARRKAGEM